MADCLMNGVREMRQDVDCGVRGLDLGEGGLRMRVCRWYEERGEKKSRRGRYRIFAFETYRVAAAASA